MNNIRVVLLVLLLSLLACRATDSKKNKELLIYCGITMEKPISDIARIIEKEENCKIIITKGGSGNLYKSVSINKVGDLYFPGSESYIKQGISEKLISDTVFVGVNKAVLMIKKGNPLKISDDLENLVNPNIKVVIGNPFSGSIGKETQNILNKSGLEDEVCEKVCYYTTDSKDLINSIKNNDADMIINWYATSTWDDNKNIVDVIPIDSKYAEEKKLYIGLLKYSKYPEIAKKFMNYASSDKGKKIFKEYGLYKD